MTIKEICEKFGYGRTTIYSFVKHNSDGLLKGHISKRVKEKHRTGARLIEIDDYGVRVILEKLIPSDVTKVLSEQQSIIDSQKSIIEEKDEHIKMLEMNYRLLEIRVGSMERENANRYIG